MNDDDEFLELCNQIIAHGFGRDFIRVAKELKQRIEHKHALLKTIRQYDHVIQAVATALGGVCCGGIDVEGPGSTKEVLVGEIEKLKAEQRIWMGS